MQQTAASQTTERPDIPDIENSELKADTVTVFGADHAEPKTIHLGAMDPNTENPQTGFKFQLLLTSQGAAIKRATFSDGEDKGFDDRNYKDPKPLAILSPVKNEIFSMANNDFVFVEQGQHLPLNKLHWQAGNVESLDDGSQKVSFETIIKTSDGQPTVKLTKTYKLSLTSYMLECDILVQNLSLTEQKVQFDLTGPVGMNREGVRGDMRKVVAGFRDSNGNITSHRLDVKKLDKAQTVEERRLIKNADKFLWASTVNKYFAAIVAPVPDEGKQYCNWIQDKTGRYYNPDGIKDSGDETVGLNFKIASTTLAPQGQENSSKQYGFKVFLGPKDKRLFDKNDYYKNLGFLQTIDFMACCCPAGLINPLAFGILAVMEWMYTFIGNYGVVIIILVLCIRIAIHPLTKKSQVSMSKFSKLAPKMEEIKKKYTNKAEQQKHIMTLYKEQGASPIMGMLPMMAQMPIWIALYSAIYASISLRGAAFLPFWITDLSAPDALVRFATVTIPFVGWKIDSFNLLPLLMGVAFYLQQKLMPKQATAATNPQAAQQQKMMMVMMPILFPVMLYKAPSGLNLYIMASTFAGVIEQYIIRKHIREKEESESKGLVAVTSKTGGKMKKKKPKPFSKKYI